MKTDFDKWKDNCSDALDGDIKTKNIPVCDDKVRNIYNRNGKCLFLDLIIYSDQEQDGLV